MKKVYATAAEALDGLLHDGMLIAAGGFVRGMALERGRVGS